MSSELFDQFGSNYGYIEDIYKVYLDDPSLVSEKWRLFFNDFESRLSNDNGFTKTNNIQVRQVENSTPSEFDEDSRLQERVYRLIYSYRNYGHLHADINPLKSIKTKRPYNRRLDPDYYKITEEQLNSTVHSYRFQNNKSLVLKDLLDELKRIYCGSIGFEYQHILDEDERYWLRDKIEQRFEKGFKQTNQSKIRSLQKVIDAEVFESELHTKYIGQKRFSLEGAETLIPMVSQMIEDGCKKDHKELVIGMAHRGRLNILRNIMGKPLQDIFYEFEDASEASVLGSGDVKYHIGFKSKYASPDNKKLDLVLCPNPSHLEFVYPVTLGVCRAKQELKYNNDLDSVLPLILHGDSAFVGQGIVPETLNFFDIEGFSTGGSVHIIINNQIGFTTTPDEYSSTIYSTDFAKAVQAPILHINAEDVEAACWASNLAIEYRNKFHKDIVLDLYAYRKYGHNEGDDPSFTQPLIYNEIKTKKSISKIYSEKLIADGVITDQDITDYKKQYKADFDKEQSVKRLPQVMGEACALHGKLRSHEVETKATEDDILEVANAIITYPNEFTPNPKVKRILEKKIDGIREESGIDWGLAETLAYGTLLQENVDIRLSGEDSGRGTFSHRMILINDYETADHYMTLQPLVDKYNSIFNIYNTTLSECGILGFEFGYSTIATDPLVIWEAQFGDFANGAQVIIDQFVSSSEQKWHQLSGLVMLLPHGFEGQGPEHSSARLERFLQLCADGNMRVTYPTNAAQCFHLLRDQAKSKLKRPLVVMSPKSLLRAKDACCNLEDLTEGSYQPLIINDFGVSGKKTKVVFTSGKVYYDIEKALSQVKKPNVRVIRVEQLYPFPQFEARKAIRDIDPKDCAWVQEEPLNMGAWLYIEPYLRTKLGLSVEYVGRETSASPATGSAKRHAIEQRKIVSDLFNHLGLDYTKIEL